VFAFAAEAAEFVAVLRATWQAGLEMLEEIKGTAYFSHICITYLSRNLTFVCPSCNVMFTAKVVSRAAVL